MKNTVLSEQFPLFHSVAMNEFSVLFYRKNQRKKMRAYHSIVNGCPVVPDKNNRNMREKIRNI